MLQRLIASRLITPPAIWGKLPGHADFVRSAMRHGESEGWQPWLAQQGQLDGVGTGVGTDIGTDIGTGAALPTAFVLPPGTLSFARRRFVIGVITPSTDKVGRQHPLLVYHLAHPGWIKAHFSKQALLSHDWLFWLARAVARHTGTQGSSDVHALERTVQRLWRLHAPDIRQLWGPEVTPIESAETRRHLVQGFLDQLTGPAPVDDPAAQLCGVRFFPWADWPQRLYRARGTGAFWQQDAAGGYVNVAARLPMLRGEW